MRQALQPYLKQRIRVRAVVGISSVRTEDPSVQTLILYDVKEHATKERLAEHIWIRQNGAIKKAKLRQGDQIEMTVICDEYVKTNGETSIGLIMPQGIRQVR